jgi:hypothetical protein
MNPSKKLLKVIGSGSLLALALGFGGLAFAGPPPEFWNRAKPITSVKDAAAVKDDATVAMVCGACKTVLIRDSRYVGPSGKGRADWFTIGSEHKCDHCGGSIKVVRGKTADTMEHNCTKCGDHAAFCCAVPPATAAKK